MRIEIQGSKPIEKKETTQDPFLMQKKIVKEKLSNVKRVIAVHSGKGGVGKSTFSINLAATLSKKNYSVGLLDADVDCPSIHKMLGLSKQRIKFDENKLFMPLESFGIKVLSIGNLVENEETANVMRGPMMFKLIFEMLTQTNWGNLDFLIIDLPPGTGDNPLTIMQITPLFGLIIVSQPQEVAVIDAKKSVDMAQKLGVKVLGFVENMSGDAFGSGNIEKEAKKLSIPFLGKIPLLKSIREHSDFGKPIVFEDQKIFEIFSAIIKKAILETNLK